MKLENIEIIVNTDYSLHNYIYSRDGFVEAIDNLVKEFTEGKTDEHSLP